MSGLSSAPWHVQEPLPIPEHEYAVVSDRGEFIAAVRTREDALAIAAVPLLMRYCEAALQTLLTVSPYEMPLDLVPMLEATLERAEGRV